MAVTGWTFAGATVYFVQALLRSSWLNAAGQLGRVLARDVVLTVPLLTRLPAVALEQRMNLIIYTLVVSHGGLLAIFHLIHQAARTRGRLAAQRA